MGIISSFVINWRFRQIDHNGSQQPASVLCTQNEKAKVVLWTLFLVYFSKFLTVNQGLKHVARKFLQL